jgi:hypothetical protein
MKLDHFTDLDDVLAVGSYPHTPEHIISLRDSAGIGAILNLQSDADLRTRGIDWNVMWPLYTRLGMLTTRVPIRDFTPSDLARSLDTAVEALSAFRAQGKKVYVHCNAGLNRSPSVVIAFLVATRGLSVQAAIDWLDERHECVPYPDVLTAWARTHGYPLDG